MKALHRFLTEQGRKKKEEAKKPHAVKGDEGADDKEFISLMDEYKQARREDPKGSRKILKKAQKLKNVSRTARIAASYL